MIAWIIGMTVATTICLLYYLINEKPYENGPLEASELFVVSAYLSRMEQATLDILEAQEDADQTIILWWGLDGLQLNEDGSLEWVSRKKTKPVPAEVFYQPCQSIKNVPCPDWYNQLQSTTERIDELMARNTEMMRNLQSPMPGYLGYSTCMQPLIATQLTQCCCTNLRQTFS